MTFLADENIPFLMAALAFVVICLISVGIMIYVRNLGFKRGMLDKIRTREEDWGDMEAPAPDLGITEDAKGALARFVSAIGMKTRRGKAADDADIKLKFLKAGLRGRNVVTLFWGTKILLAVVFATAFCAMVILFFKAMAAEHIVLGVAFCAFLGLVLPDMWLRSKIKGRRERLTRAFPDMLDLLVVCVEAGMGLDAAINRVGEELALSHPELSSELKLLNLELRAGKSRNTALRNLAARTDVDDVNSLVTLLIQTDRFGTSVAQALKVFSDSFRTARFQRAEEFAAKIATKLIFPLALFIFPSFFVVAVGPAAVQIYRVLIKG